RAALATATPRLSASFSVRSRPSRDLSAIVVASTATMVPRMREGVCAQTGTAADSAAAKATTTAANRIGVLRRRAPRKSRRTGSEQRTAQFCSANALPRHLAEHGAAADHAALARRIVRGRAMQDAPVVPHDQLPRRPAVPVGQVVVHDRRIELLDQRAALG